MLPGIGFSEILVLGLAALIFIGPKDLPTLMRKLLLGQAHFIFPFCSAACH